MIIILLTFVACMILGIVVSDRWVDVWLFAEVPLDAPWCRLEPANGWLQLMYVSGETYDLDDKAPPGRHWWGGFMIAGPSGEKDWRLELPAWEPIVLLLLYPMSALTHGLLLRLRRRITADQLTNRPVETPERNRCGQAGWLKATFLTISLFLAVMATIFTLTSWLITASAAIASKGDESTNAGTGSFRFDFGVSEGAFKAILVDGLDQGGLGVLVHWYGGLANYSTTDRRRYFLAYIPSWEIIGLFGLYPAVVLALSVTRRVRRRRRRVRGLCIHCGYNLTGNVSGVCPECGQGAEARSF